MKKVKSKLNTLYLVKGEEYLVIDETGDKYFISADAKLSIWYPKDYFEEVVK